MRSAKLKFLILLFVLSPVGTLSANDISDYRLRVEILWTRWESLCLNVGSPYPRWIYKGNGRGNVKDGSAVHAFDFTYEGPLNVGFGPPTYTYLARWKRPQSKLEILMPEVGHKGKYEPCDVHATVHAGVYLGKGQAITEISQADYEARKAHPEIAAEGPEQPAAVSNLSVTSNPAGAEIEIDGKFAGMTPSVLQLGLAEHTITVHKTGYKPWEEKMKLVAGENKLRANLESETPR